MCCAPRGACVPLLVAVVVVFAVRCGAWSGPSHTGDSFVRSSAFCSPMPLVVVRQTGGEIVSRPRKVSAMTILDCAEPQARGGNGCLTCLDMGSEFWNYNGTADIRIRGKTSQIYDKKSYGFHTVDASREEVKIQLLGFPKHYNWVLYAPYCDRPMFRNVLSYALSNSVGRYASRTRFVELFVVEPGRQDVHVDTDYRGVYVLEEKVCRGKNRVNITKMTKDDITPPAVTGGYLLKLDKLDPDDVVFNTTLHTQVIVEYPKEKNLAPEHLSYIKQYLDDFEGALNSGDYVHAYSLIDVDTFVDHFLLQELAKNVDGLRLNTFIQKDRSRPLVLGPIWDLDIAWGNADYYEGNVPAGWQFRVSHPATEVSNVPFWWEALFLHAEFQQRVSARWRALRGSGPFSTSALLKLCGDYVGELADVEKRNFEQWPIMDRYIWPSPAPPPHTYEVAVQRLTTFLQLRTAWMDENIDKIGRVVGL